MMSSSYTNILIVYVVTYGQYLCLSLIWIWLIICKAPTGQNADGLDQLMGLTAQAGS